MCIYIHIYWVVFMTSLYMYSDATKTIQCAHPLHHRNAFVATCRLWMVSGGSSSIVSVRTNRVLNKHWARGVYILIETEIGSWHTECSIYTKQRALYIYSEAMKTIQCAHPPHHHNGCLATCRLWTAIGGVHALLVWKPLKGSTSTRLGV